MNHILSNTTKRALQNSERAKGALADLFKKSPLTISRWIDADNPQLTTYAAVEIIKKELSIAQEDVFNQETAAA